MADDNLEDDALEGEGVAGVAPAHVVPAVVAVVGGDGGGVVQGGEEDLAPIPGAGGHVQKKPRVAAKSMTELTKDYIAQALSRGVHVLILSVGEDGSVSPIPQPLVHTTVRAVAAVFTPASAVNEHTRRAALVANSPVDYTTPQKKQEVNEALSEWLLFLLCMPNKLLCLTFPLLSQIFSQLF